MTPARKNALQWFHDRGEVCPFSFWPNGPIKPKFRPSKQMMDLMIKDEQLAFSEEYGTYTLTDAGRRALNGDSK